MPIADDNGVFRQGYTRPFPCAAHIFTQVLVATYYSAVLREQNRLLAISKDRFACQIQFFSDWMMAITRPCA